MFKKILIATDNSKLMKSTVPYTVTLFPRAEFHVVNVIDTTTASVPMSSLLRRTLNDLAEEAINKAEKVLTGMGVSQVEKTILSGRPYREILNHVKNNDIKLVVMATHSKSGTQRLHIGQCCRAVLEHVHCPVMLINKPPKQERPKKILNPTTGSKYSHRGSVLATILANNFGATLTLLYLGAQSKFDAEVNFVGDIASSTGVDLRTEYCEGNPEECVVEAAAKHDLIVASRGRSGFTYKLRSFIPELALGKLEREIIVETTIPFIMHAQ